MILTPKPAARPLWVYAYSYSIADAAHEGLPRVGQTIRDMEYSVAELIRT